MKKIIFLLFKITTCIFVVILAGFGGLVSWEQYTLRTRYYKTYQESISNEYSKNGWIPEFVPTDAYDITEAHELSPERQFLSFKFTDSDNFRRKIQDYTYKSLKPIRILNNQVKWLPSPLSKAAQIETYQMPDYQGACLIVVWSSKKAYFRSHNCLK